MDNLYRIHPQPGFNFNGISQLNLFAPPLSAVSANRSPYLPFDPAAARKIILEQLHRAGGEWVRRMAIRRATGMRPSEVASLLDDLARTGLIEFTETMDIIHPSHGHMGQTRGYRMPSTGASEVTA
ncbi:MAG TPA: hypothetical protein DCX26_01015 [Pseudomonas sp.]|jgi:hypothetical protein|nr:hypothetical protein [Pseudomonas sp.]HAW60900.1 hypothetical protein [Pseudomonas sp.]|tara:strand:- start:12527 stop:12904 length:378 start_codon:yes stop_codon:yes gene_type:complete